MHNNNCNFDIVKMVYLFETIIYIIYNYLFYVTYYSDELIAFYKSTFNKFLFTNC